MPRPGRIICQAAQVSPRSTRAWIEHGLEIVRAPCDLIETRLSDRPGRNLEEHASLAGGKIIGDAEEFNNVLALPTPWHARQGLMIAKLGY